VGDEAAAEGALLMIVLRQGPVEVARRGRESVDERLSVKGCFTDAGGYMRSRNEGSITEERNPPEDDTRRFQIKDGLKQWLRSPMDDRRHLWGQRALGTRLEVLYDFWSYQRRGDCHTVLAAGGVGAEPGKTLVEIYRSAPNEVVPAPLGAEVVASPWVGHREQQLALGEAEGHMVEEPRLDLNRRVPPL
jgi:hypothetical protein